MKELGIYVHIPFCLRKCSYCDFVSYPFRGEGEEFFSLLFEELRLKVHALQLEGRKVCSVYFGGGTPSILAPSLFGDFLRKLQSYCTLSFPLEVTLEVNPETVTEARLLEWREAGILRLSLGVQSFAPRYLFLLGRSASLETLHRALQKVVASGWENWNIDLIYGLPLQDFDSWGEDLSEALRYAPPHISVYNLTLSPVAPLFSFFRRHFRLFPSPDEQAYLFRFAEERLAAAGYVHYEVSNFARPGYECRHNLLYWRNGEYLGLGPSSWSHVGGKRQKNAKTLRGYRKALENGRCPIVFEEELSREEKVFEDFLLLLRTRQGVPLSLVHSFEDQELRDLLLAFVAEGLLLEEDGRLYPSSSGFLLLHQVLAEVFARRVASPLRDLLRRGKRWCSSAE
jgi:oxygen-independent coproporphyrinogen-3 oxidase